MPQDADDLRDVYVAGVGGGLGAQHATTEAGCEGEACRGEGTDAPDTDGAGTAAFAGPGNQTPTTGNGNAFNRCNRVSRQAQRLARRSARTAPRRASHEQPQARPPLAPPRPPPRRRRPQAPRRSQALQASSTSRQPQPEGWTMSRRTKTLTTLATSPASAPSPPSPRRRAPPARLAPGSPTWLPSRPPCPPA